MQTPAWDRVHFILAVEKEDAGSIDSKTRTTNFNLLACWLVDAFKFFEEGAKSPFADMREDSNPVLVKLRLK